MRRENYMRRPERAILDWRSQAGWRLFGLAAMLGGLLSLGGLTMVRADGFGYLSDNPETCANCHVMREVFDAWNHSSHKAFATCNDCHTPHAFPDKYLVKAINGWNHSSAFTTGTFPEPIRITPFNRAIALDNCFDCHTGLVTLMGQGHEAEPTDCLRCHTGVGHRQ
jgi:cytochrome c nitrite reductase small subunit